MAGVLLLRVWDPEYGYNARADIEYKPAEDDQYPRYCYLYPVVKDATSCIELASPCMAERACDDDGVAVVIFEGDLIRAFFSHSDVIHNGLVGRNKNTGEWIVFDDVIRYDEHGNPYVRNLETCSKACLHCLTHIQITGNIHDYKKD